MIHQLRIYEIFEHNKSAFHQRFHDHAARIMRQYGFEIIGMWEVKIDRRTEFVYVLAWPDETAKNAAWARFMANDEWKEIKRVTSCCFGTSGARRRAPAFEAVPSLVDVNQTICGDPRQQT